MKKELVNLFRTGATWVKDRSPALCLIGSCIGLGFTIYTTARATKNIIYDLDDLTQDDISEEDAKKETIKIVTKRSLPVLMAAGGTLACNFGCYHVLNAKVTVAESAAALATSQAMRLRDNVVKRLEPDIAKDIQDKVDEENIAELVQKGNYISGVAEGNTLFYDPVSNQMFRSSKDYILEGARLFNQDLRGDDWHSVNEWLYFLPVRPFSSKHPFGSEYGWGELADGKDALIISFAPSEYMFENGETATKLVYETIPYTEGDYRSMSCY